MGPDLSDFHLAPTPLGFVPDSEGWVGEIDVAWLREVGYEEGAVDRMCFGNFLIRLKDRIRQHVTIDIG